jgi:hypothetical protein
VKTALADISRLFIDHSRILLTDSYLPGIEMAVDGVSTANLDPSTLLERRHIQSYDVTVMRICAVVEHFSMHTGQIILLAKTIKGDPGFYDISGGDPRPTWKGGVAGHSRGARIGTD